MRQLVYGKLPVLRSVSPANHVAGLDRRNFMEQQNGPQKNDSSRNFAGWVSLGFEFAGVLAVLCYIGYKLDKAWDTSPWFLVAGLATGLIGMFYMIFKQAWYLWRK